MTSISICVCVCVRISCVRRSALACRSVEPAAAHGARRRCLSVSHLLQTVVWSHVSRFLCDIFHQLLAVNNRRRRGVNSFLLHLKYDTIRHQWSRNFNFDKHLVNYTRRLCLYACTSGALASFRSLYLPTFGSTGAPTPHYESDFYPNVLRRPDFSSITVSVRANRFQCSLYMRITNSTSVVFA